MKGYSLVELMVVMAIIGILAAIAYLLYIDYVYRSRRIDAQSIILNIQLLQEKYRVNHPAYGAFANLGPIPSSEYYTFVVSVTSAIA